MLFVRSLINVWTNERTNEQTNSNINILYNAICTQKHKASKQASKQANKQVVISSTKRKSKHITEIKKASIKNGQDAVGDTVSEEGDEKYSKKML